LIRGNCFSWWGIQKLSDNSKQVFLPSRSSLVGPRTSRISIKRVESIFCTN